MEALLAHVLDAAGRAPSAHNTQPWRLCWRGDRLEVRVPESRMLPAVDPAGADALHGVGAMLENILLTFAQLGHEGRYEVAERLVPDAAVLSLRWRPSAAPRPDPMLYRMIPVRRTSRIPYRSDAVSAAILDAMRHAVAAPCTLRVLDDDARVTEVRRLVAHAAALQLADAAIMRELYGWMRFSPRDPRWRRDGLNAACMGFNAVEAAIAARLLAPRMMGILVRLGLHRALCATVDQQAPPAPVLCLLTASGEGIATRIEAGRCLQRVWLTAAAHGLVTHPLSAAVDVVATRPRTLELFDIGAGEKYVNLFRLGYSDPPARSPRLPVDEILVREED